MGLLVPSKRRLSLSLPTKPHWQRHWGLSDVTIACKVPGNHVPMHLKPLGMVRRGKRWQVGDDLDPTTSSSNGLSLQNQPCTSVTMGWSRRTFVPMASRPMQAVAQRTCLMAPGTINPSRSNVPCALSRGHMAWCGPMWRSAMWCDIAWHGPTRCGTVRSRGMVHPGAVPKPWSSRSRSRAAGCRSLPA